MSKYIVRDNDVYGRESEKVGTLRTAYVSNKTASLKKEIEAFFIKAGHTNVKVNVESTPATQIKEKIEELRKEMQIAGGKLINIDITSEAFNALCREFPVGYCIPQNPKVPVGTKRIMYDGVVVSCSSDK